MDNTLADRYAPRERKAEKILAILQDYLGQKLEQKTCLDVGCSTGLISRCLAERFRLVVGLDIDENSLKQAAVSLDRGAHFLLADGVRLPVADNRLDVVVCAQVYEHAADLPGLASEIWRVLRPGGLCFLSGPNKYALVEEHYWLPFLSWLPQPLADRYMRLAKRGQTYDIAPRSYWQLRRAWQRFELHDYAWQLIQRPADFGLEAELRRLVFLRHWPGWLAEGLGLLMPNFNWILVKPE